MGVDVFGNEIKPSDLILFSSSGNGYFEMGCVTRIMPKSVEYDPYPNCVYKSRVNNNKIIILSLEKAREYNQNNHNMYTALIQHAVQMKEEFNI